MILSDDEAEPDPLPEDVAQGLDMMTQESSKDPVNLSYPYADATSKTVVATSATADGQARATELTLTASRNSDPTVTYTAQPVQHSRQFLDHVMDEVIGRQPEGFNVIASYPDPQHNRIVAEVDKLDDAFLYRLAGTYGDTAIAVRVTPEDGYVVAKGIIGGAAGWGGSDAYAGALDSPCRTIFTDIWDAYYGLPGDIN